jgi:phytoene dehydrogenase-like protein
MPNLDAIVVGAGPNGLTAAIVLARAGLKVEVFEAADEPGGGARTMELTLPGFRHDVCASILPTAHCSPILRTFPLEQYGLKWLWSPAVLAHPVEHGSAILEIGMEETACRLPRSDAERYRAIFAPARDALAALLERGIEGLIARFGSVASLGLRAVGSGASLCRKFESEPARALIAGMAGHAMLPLTKAATAGIAIGLGAAGHVGGWPFPQGGAQSLTSALVAYLHSLGGKVRTGACVRSLRELPETHAVLLDVGVKQVLGICGDHLPSIYRKVLENFRYGPGAFKVDWALSQPVPWNDVEVSRAATVHIGGPMEEVLAAEREPYFGRISERPFLIAAQHTLTDPTRAPEGRHTLWGYCHVPNGCTVDMTEKMEAQIERFAPGFRDCILARSVHSPADLERHNPNLVGGDIAAGAQDLWQLMLRPSLRYWSTPIEHVFLCSASTPPGAGVHGMCGYFAAAAALKRRFDIQAMPLFPDAQRS